MKNNTYYVDEIKDRITMHDVLTRYGFKVGRDKRIPCPFHNGKDKNLGYKPNFFKCFVCGASGDVITFVQKYHGLSFTDTLVKIDNDFALGLGIGNELQERERLALAKKSFEAKLERKKRQMAHERLEKAYHDAYDELARLDRQQMQYRPKSDDDVVHPLFIEAISKIEIARHELECAEKELYLYEQQHSN